MIDNQKTAVNPDPQLDPDPAHPVAAPHDSHDWDGGSSGETGYFLECQVCGARDHWPAARLACVRAPRERGKPSPALSLGQAVRLIYLDLDAFAVWWLAREKTLGLIRPTLAEWRAEFLIWSKGAKPDREA